MEELLEFSPLNKVKFFFQLISFSIISERTTVIIAITATKNETNMLILVKEALTEI